MNKIDWNVYDNLDFDKRVALINELEGQGYLCLLPINSLDNRDSYVITPSGKRVSSLEIEKGLKKLIYGNNDQIELINSLKLLALKGCKGAIYKAEYVVAKKIN